MARSLLLALCVALCVAAATATSCTGKRRYTCINSHTFCNGGVAQQCPAGTTCVTQSDKNYLKISPCVTRAAKHPSHKPHRPSGHPRHLLGGSHKPTSHKPVQHKPQPSHPAPSCHLANYVCLPPTAHKKTSTRFCLGGVSMACPAGTVCRTQPRSRRQSASPCVWP